VVQAKTKILEPRRREGRNGFKCRLRFSSRSLRLSGEIYFHISEEFDSLPTKNLFFYARLPASPIHHFPPSLFLRIVDTPIDKE
jgi:hypothetical protein